MKKDNFENIRQIDEVLRDNGIVLDDRTPIKYIEARKDGIYIEFDNDINYKDIKFESGREWLEIKMTKYTKETLTDEDREIIADRGKYKEFYVMHYDVETCKDSLNEKLEFKTYEDAVDEFNETQPRNKTDRVELIFSPEENYGDNVLIFSKME